MASNLDAASCVGDRTLFLVVSDTHSSEQREKGGKLKQSHPQRSWSYLNKHGVKVALDCVHVFLKVHFHELKYQIKSAGVFMHYFFKATEHKLEHPS